MKNVLYKENDDGEIEEIPLPTRREVCHTCDGRGTTVFGWGGGEDAAVFTQEDFDEDRDLAENLSEGMYDKTCPDCRGRNVVDVVDEELLETKNPELLAQWYAQQREEAEHRAACRAERRMGA